MKVLTILTGLLLTFSAEYPFFHVFGFKGKKFNLAFFLSNAFTNLTLNLVLLFVSETAYPWLLLSGEILAVLIESFSYWFLDKKRVEVFPLTLSANAFSFLIGLLYYSFVN